MLFRSLTAVLAATYVGESERCHTSKTRCNDISKILLGHTWCVFQLTINYIFSCCAIVLPSNFFNHAVSYYVALYTLREVVCVHRCVESYRCSNKPLLVTESILVSFSFSSVWPLHILLTTSLININQSTVCCRTAPSYVVM